MTQLALVGICKGCKRVIEGQVVQGRFLCSQCQNPSWIPPSTTGTQPYGYYFTFTTSNSTGPSDKE